MTLSFEPIRLHQVEDGDGRIVSYDGVLVAILVRLSDLHQDDADKWFVEVGFGSVKRLEGRCFEDLDSSLPHIEAAARRDRPSSV